MFRRLLGLAGLATVSLIVSGCIDATTLVIVEKDGSGKVMETVFVGKAMDAMMQQMMGGMAESMAGVEVEDTGSVTVSMPDPGASIDEDECRAKAIAMGEGVRFVSASEVSKADGSKGVQTLYAFDDIRELKISSEPDTPSGPDAEDEEAKESTPITFAFTAGDAPTLSIRMPPHDEGAMEEADEDGNEGEVTADEMPAEQMAQMRQMFDGFRFRIMLKVAGAITDTNASFLGIGSQSGLKQYVTLLDMNIGELMKSEEMFKKLVAKGEMQDMGTAMAKLNDIPGLRIETAQQVDITFE